MAGGDRRPRASQHSRHRGIERHLTRTPTMLIMDGPGRSAHARRDRDRAGSGGKRTANAETQVVVPVIGGVPVAVRGAEVVWIVVPGTAADDTATRGRPGFKGAGRIEPPAPEDRVAQPPRIGMLGMSDPGAHARINIVKTDRFRPATGRAARAGGCGNAARCRQEGGDSRRREAQSRETAPARGTTRRKSCAGEA